MIEVKCKRIGSLVEDGRTIYFESRHDEEGRLIYKRLDLKLNESKRYKPRSTRSSSLRINKT